MKKLKAFWIKLIGPSEQFSLEARIFHAFCIISLIAISVNMIINVIDGMPIIILTALLLGCSIFFYLSRFKNKLTLSIFFFCLISHILFSVNFYLTSGIDGKSLFSLLLSLFLAIAIVPKRLYLFFILLNLFLVVGLITISYQFPGLIHYSYPSLLSRYTDLGASYILIALLIFFLLSYLRSSYYREKKLTEQKAAELYLSDQTKNKLLSILAHDLRSPLSSIQNYLEVLLEYDIDEDEKKTMQANLLKETKSTQQMLSNLLSWGKTQMSGVVVNLSEVNLKKTLIPAFQAQQSMAAEKCIDLENNIDDSICIVADSDMLQLVIRNLINNAIKFTPAGGRINISSKSSEDRCLIVITDNGKGIPYDMQADLFSLKAKSTYGTQNEKGIGLGLALCKEYTEIQNGKIWFESEPGVGTSFYISLIHCSPIPKKFAGRPAPIKAPDQLTH